MCSEEKEFQEKAESDWVCGLSVIGLFVLVAGCHGRESKETDAPLKPGELANRGRAEIVEECGKQSYDLVSKGLIVSETGLHEDVFVLRDRVTLGGLVIRWVRPCDWSRSCGRRRRGERIQPSSRRVLRSLRTIWRG